MDLPFVPNTNQFIGGERGPHHLKSKHAQTLVENYDLVFGDRLYVGSCLARSLQIKFYTEKGIAPAMYIYKHRNYNKRRNKANLPPLPTGRDPLFIDLQNLPESRDSINEYMIPVLMQQAYSIAQDLRRQRLVCINCRLGQNRSAMFAIAVVLAYKRMYGQDPKDKTITASQVLSLLQPKRPELSPEAWVMDGFRVLHYEPQHKRFRHRPASSLEL